MRLTTSIRQAFVSAVLADVPKTDYQEQLRDITMKDSYAQLPLAIQKLVDVKL